MARGRTLATCARFERARVEHADRRRTVFRAKTLAERPLELPEINLDHLPSSDDDTGILQHAAFSVPRYEDGYCLDDNARALLLTPLLEDAGIEDMKAVRMLASRYLAFVSHAFDARIGRFRNFMSYSRQWLEERGSEDSHGRALWALGAVIGRSSDPGRQSLADAALPLRAARRCGVHEPARLGVCAARHRRIPARIPGRPQGPGGAQAGWPNVSSRCTAATGTAEWPWFEERVTYGNARLSQALLVSGSRMEHEEMKAAGLRSLRWLSGIQHASATDGYFAPIGSNGFYERGGTKAAFDQQPVEACAMVSACLDARSGDRR